jgi:hypothetical protein
MISELQWQPVAGKLPYASVQPNSLADIVKNDLAVLLAALELVRDQGDLPLELRALVSGALARSSDMVDHVRELRRMACERDGGQND